MTDQTPNQIPFLLPGFQIEETIHTADSLIVRAQSVASEGYCPQCGARTDRVHSTYTRTPRDLPSSDRAVQLQLLVRRFRCLNATCSRQIFAERLPELLPCHAQRTTRLTQALRELGFALGGEAGARVMRRLHMPCSGDTLLRVMRGTSLDEPTSPCVIGVDDWARRKGRVYGTIIVDLERSRPIDLLADREAPTLAAWLQAHPGVEVVSRDRDGVYADAVRQSLPDAIQVADRWHLLKNLGDALATDYDRHHRLLRRIAVPRPQRQAPQAAPPLLSSTAIPPPRRPERPPTPQEVARQQRRQYWLTRFQQVHELRDQGYGINAIARHLGLNRRTVRKYARLDELPRKTSPKSGPRLIDPYRAYLRERIQAANPSTRQLWREIRARGFPGGHTTVYDFVAQVRRELGIPPLRRSPRSGSVPPGPAAPHRSARSLTARQLAALTLRLPDKLSDAQCEVIAQACRLHPDIHQATQLARDFAALLRQRRVAQLDAWIGQTLASDLPGLTGFARGLQRDYEAVRAAFIYSWSNGPVEGHINRLKVIKRQLYGRANFDLLRQCVLYAYLHQT